MPLTPNPLPLPRVRALAALVAVLTLAALAPLAADPQTRPNGPWVQDEQTRNLNGFRDHEQLGRELRRIEASSGGRMAVEVVGRSNEGREIYLAKVGSGSRAVLYLTQQHGNEPHGSEAALQALRTLASSGSAEARQIREELTVLMVVRANPDGAERFWRQNVDPECDPEQASCLPGRGYDPNRWHDPRIADADVPVPEALAIREVVDRFGPELIVDYHGQLSYRTSDGEMVTTSVLWPIFPSSVEVTAERQQAIDDGKRVSVLLYDTVERYGHGTVTQFPPGTTMGTARNGYAYLGIPSVLFEQRADAGQKSIGMLVRQATATMLEVAAAVADGSLASIDPDRVEEIPPRGPRVTNPRSGRQVDDCAGVGIARSVRGDVRDADGRLYDAVVDYAAERILESGSEAYVRPTLEEGCTMAAAFQEIVDGNLDVAAGLVQPFDYEVLRLSDPSTGRDHVLLAELLSGEQVERGWGLYVHTPDAAAPVSIQAPYATFATFSERQAAQIFDEVHAENLFVAGAHRRANAADDDASEPANVTQNTDSVFHRIHQQVTSGAEDTALQILGTGGDVRDVTVTAGEAPPGDLAQTVADTLTGAGYEVCLYGDGTCTSLPSTQNVQGQWSRSVDASWAAVYPSFQIRRLLSRRSAFAEAIAPALGG